MWNDDLESLIKEADAEMGPPPTSADLARHVRIIARKRRNSRLALGSSAAVGLLVAIMLLLHTLPKAVETAHRTPTAIPSLADDLRQLQQSIARIESEADLRQAAVQDWQAKSELAKLNRQLTALEADDPIQRGMEQAARMMLVQANSMENQLGLQQPAVNVYRRLIEQFPQTVSAECARQRSDEIRKLTTGESS